MKSRQRVAWAYSNLIELYLLSLLRDDLADPAEAVARAWRAPTVVLCLAELDRIGAPGWFAGRIVQATGIAHPR